MVAMSISRRDLFCIYLLMCLVLACSSVCSAAKVIRITDGDTMTLLVDSKPLRIRLANIDAPEKNQPFGQKSKESLSDICWGADATYDAQTVDRYGRTVAVVFCNSVEANREQVRRGMAWVYSKYNKDKNLPEIELKARSDRVGLWFEKDNVEPWVFRLRISIKEQN